MTTLAGHLLDHLRSGNKHLCVAGLDNEIGQRRTVSRAAGTGSANNRYLRHRSRQHGVAIENPAITGEAVDPLLDPCSARIINKNERAAGFQRHIHDFCNLVAMDLSGGAPSYGEVLTGQMDKPTVDGGAAGDHAVGWHFLLRHAEQRGAMLGEKSDLLEAVGIG